MKTIIFWVGHLWIKVQRCPETRPRAGNSTSNWAVWITRCFGCVGWCCNSRSFVQRKKRIRTQASECRGSSGSTTPSMFSLRTNSGMLGLRTSTICADEEEYSCIGNFSLNLIPLGVTFCHWIFFYVVKPLMSILPLLPISSIYEKLVWITMAMCDLKLFITNVCDFGLYYILKTTCAVVDQRGVYFSWSKFFHFYAVFGKRLPNNKFAPLPLALALLSGKS